MVMIFHLVYGTRAAYHFTVLSKNGTRTYKFMILDELYMEPSSSSFSSPMAYPSCSVTSINLRTADRSNRGSFCRSSHMGKSRWSSKRLKVLARLLKHQYSHSYFYDHHFSILFRSSSLHAKFLTEMAMLLQ